MYLEAKINKDRKENITYHKVCPLEKKIMKMEMSEEEIVKEKDKKKLQPYTEEREVID